MSGLGMGYTSRAQNFRNTRDLPFSAVQFKQPFTRNWPVYPQIVIVFDGQMINNTGRYIFMFVSSSHFSFLPYNVARCIKHNNHIFSNIIHLCSLPFTLGYHGSKNIIFFEIWHIKTTICESQKSQLLLIKNINLFTHMTYV